MHLSSDSDIRPKRVRSIIPMLGSVAEEKFLRTDGELPVEYSGCHLSTFRPRSGRPKGSPMNFRAAYWR
jgi:hypothetical protein